MLKLLIVAGEPSGDIHAASLITALRKQSPNIELVGMGGPRMREAGANILFDITGTDIVGFTEALVHIRRLKRLLQSLSELIDIEKPDGVILIDYPGFNLRLAARAKKRGVKVIYYISPQVWAWGKGRIKEIARLVDKMIVILPFEEKFYSNEKIRVEFVGHPILDIIETFSSEGIVGETIAILPGSRQQEVHRHLPLMLDAASLMRKERPELQFVILLPPSISPSVITAMSNIGGIRIMDLAQEAPQKKYEAMAAAPLLLIASGTATLEGACVGAPMLIIYKVSFLTWLLSKMLLKIPYIGLVNVVAGKKVAPEFLQFNARPERIAKTALDLLTDKEKMNAMRKELKEVKTKLGTPGASERTASIILKEVG
ncbi:lipid-A-disaccharide synthase [candidate division NPL-UPA2 bacterium Unc8]|uniref:Lipid-A-disaccharide synthase n=1 Tax=candidate division NPL-UPA2 bacterium Unc8 TaxID=1980939 RepID=A0A399FX50_UNCN2|nr:Lipid-A-disaccharide synthase [Bacillota bacterium]MBT9146789.1 Lipid-A-disaccharide synthase [Bacillota bacterium]RII00985.1 MAG: lipid-A-disaccharide synthase [candidate division NPL-UPA2 bacterium Unc8]